MKRIIALMLCVILAVTLISCNSAKAPVESSSTSTTAESTTTAKAETPDVYKPVDMRVIALKGPTGIGMAQLMNSNAEKTAVNNYTFTLAAAPDEVTAEIIKGNFDIAAVPVNLASVLYNKGADVRFLAVNTLGVLYIMENGNTISSVADLKGKTVYATGKGSTPQYVLEYVLEKNGLEIGKDVEVEYFAEHAELASKLAANAVAVGLLPEPQVTSARISAGANSNKDLRIALNMTEEWNKVSGGNQLVQGVIVVRGAFYKENTLAVWKFLDEYEASVKFVNENIDTAASYCEKYGIVPKAAVAKMAIPNCNIVCVYSADGNNYMANMLKVLFDANPASVGGKLPDGSSDFYIVLANAYGSNLWDQRQ